MEKIFSVIVLAFALSLPTMGQVLGDPTYDPLADDPTGILEDPTELMEDLFKDDTQGYGDLSYLYSLLDAANDGDADAMLELGEKYFNGDGDVAQNLSEAANWICKAAQHGNVNAAGLILMLAEEGVEYWQVLAGMMMEYGWTVDQDYAEALKLYQKAGNDANDMILRIQGKMYYKGQGVKRDYAQAFKYLYQAATLKDYPSSDAMQYLSQCYRYGHGTAKSLEKADYWLKKAQETGNDEAGQYLEEFKQKGKIR